MIDKFKGCLVGLACGDYLGSPVEFALRPEQVREFFGGEKLKPVPDTGVRDPRHIPGYYTDDTAMAICLAESLIENGFDIKDQFRRYHRWISTGYATPYGDRAFDPGQHTFRVLYGRSEDEIPEKLIHHELEGGNGALMRSAPIGLRYYQDSGLKEYSIRASIVTHSNTLSAWSCVVLDQFIAYALSGKIKRSSYCQEFLRQYPESPMKIKKVLTADYNNIDSRKLEHSGYVINTLLITLYAFFTTNDFEAAVTRAVFMAGDTDTQGAVTGALAGAYYGYKAIPSGWRNTLIRHEYIENLAIELYQQSQIITYNSAL